MQFNSDTPPEAGERSLLWKERYANRHKLERIKKFPSAAAPPKRVRIYYRRDHHVLQWWDPAEKRTLSQRIDGDLIDAIAAARRIDEKLTNYRSSGHKPLNIEHAEAVEQFVTDLERRADAGEIDPKTVTRYSSALKHFTTFVEQPRVARKWSHLSSLDREFQLAFSAHLNVVQIPANGHRNTKCRPLKGQAYVMDVVRALLEWAADPDKGNLLPSDFRSPFVRRSRTTNKVNPDPVCEPDITMTMATELLGSCDQFQLSLFAPLLLYGLRPSEVGWLFWEHVQQGWLKVDCHIDLEYWTKGRRNKRFPVLDCIRGLWQPADGNGSGLIYLNRRVTDARRDRAMPVWTLDALVCEFQRRCASARQNGAKLRRQIRNQLVRQAGQLTYDHIHAEFGKLANHLSWPSSAKPMSMRHLFSTCLENAGVPEYYRRFFMGQSFGKAPIVTYTHLTADKIHEHFQKAVDTELQPLVEAVRLRTDELDRARQIQSKQG